MTDEVESRPPVFILLSTWNGADYLGQLIASICAQRDANWRVLARDDGSSDATRQILKNWADQDERVTLVQDGSGRLGSTASFALLMRLALENHAMYFAFCDQDDLWHEAKMEHLRQRIGLLEQGQPGARPALVWSDLRWIDEQGRVLALSHFRACGGVAALSGGGLWLLAMNLVPGCAMLGNRALLEMVSPTATAVSHHDWWAALVASACGRTGVVQHALTDYRLHDGNQIGAATLNARLIGSLRAPLRALARSTETYWEAVDNAHRLACLDAPAPDQRWQCAIQHVCGTLGASSAWRRIVGVIAGPVHRVGFLRNIQMLLAAVYAPPGARTLRSPLVR